MLFIALAKKRQLYVPCLCFFDMQLMFFSGRFLSELKSPGGPKFMEALGKFI